MRLLAFAPLFFACTPGPGRDALEQEDTAGETGGPGNLEPDACTAPEAWLEECGLSPEASLYAPFFQQGCADACVADCLAEAPCAELDTVDVVYVEGGECDEVDDTTGWCVSRCDSCITPLVVSRDGGPIVLATGPGAFDFGLGRVAATDWPTAATPWLALDRDGDGAITDGTELFGDATPLRAGDVGAHGFIALRELDSSGDGHLTAADDAWPALRLWADGGDRVSTPGELSGLDAYGLVAIDLAYATEPRCDARGNCERERAPLTWVGPDGVARVGAVVDLHLRARPDARVAAAAR